MSYHLSYKKRLIKNSSFLIYGLGITGRSVVNFFNRKKIKKYSIWDDNFKGKTKFYIKNIDQLKYNLKRVDFIVLSPGISLKKVKFKKELIKFKTKIITDIDLFYLFYDKPKTIVVTGSNGKSTTCKVIFHLLKKCKFSVKLGGNIGQPILNLTVNKNTYYVIEASSFQLSHSQFIHPNFALLLNISNDHVDWHGSMNEYIKSKFKIFKLQKNKDYALINYNLKSFLLKKKFLSKILKIDDKNYKKIKSKINNTYLNSKTNDENMSFVFALSKLLKINTKLFLKSMISFKGLSHRCEIFLKKKNVTFINDSKATSLQPTKFALAANSNIFWILGGLPKHNDNINLSSVKKNIIRSYIIGKNTNFFKRILNNKIDYVISKKLKKSVISVFKDLKKMRVKKSTVLFSPGAASFDQFKNFEERGDVYKKIVKLYAKKYL